MKKSIGLYQLIGFILTSLGGTLLHFLYDWFNKAIFIAPFSSINESTWEHMKLLFWPMFIFAIVEYLSFKDLKGFWYIKLKGIMLGLILIPTLFYTFNGVIGKSLDFINITIFFISAASTYIYETKVFNNNNNNNNTSNKNENLSIIILFITALLFIIFTFITPEIGIFYDPNSKTYGIDI